MANDTVIIGCKLPNGLILEVGYHLDDHKGPVREESYQRIVLKGWNAHNTTGLQMPAGFNTRPYLNRGIDKAAWEAWKAKHKTSWLFKNEILFEAKDEASAQLRVIEGEKTPTPFAPVDPDKGLVKDIATADFAKERA